jgi:hypothetical protein
MTRSLRHMIRGATAAAFIVAGSVSASFATEPGDFTNYLRGATQGLPLGALPPPGLYAGFGLNATGLGGSAGKGDQAIPGAGTAPAFGYGFNLLWVPGWTFLGASYGAAVVQGFYQGETANTVNPPFTAAQTISPEIANTNFTPITLSWNLGHGWFTAIALTVVGPDGSRWPSTVVGTGAVDLNPDYWTLAPGWAISYLDANWLLSANFRYDVNFASAGVTMSPFIPGRAGFVDGNLLFGDLSALYKIGKWQLGPVGYFVAQTTNDLPGGGVVCTYGVGGNCGHQTQVDLGFLVGYDFGPVAVQVWADDSVYCRDCIGYGWDVWGRMNFKIWGPEAPKPLVAKN